MPNDSLNHIRNLATGFETMTHTSAPGRIQFRLRILFIVTFLVAIPLTGFVLWRQAVNRPPLDFKSLLNTVDEAIGKRFQSMQMEGMESVTYQYDGPFQTVVDIVAPIARKSGFTEESIELGDGMGAAQQEMQQKLGMDMQSVEQKMFTNPKGDTLIVSRMNIANADLVMKLLTIHFMNPSKMSASMKK
jgi:hypothetical protein